MTNQQKNALQREYRLKNGNQCTHKYEKTINGFLMRKYRNMKSRVSGVQKLKFHLYKGVDLLDKDSFYEWAKKSRKFKRLFDNWIKSGYQRKLTPSVDRINPTTGYHISNMEWVTNSENSRRSSITRRRYSPN